MTRARSSAAVALLATILLFSAACGGSSDKASTDSSGKSDTSASSDSGGGSSDTGSSDTGTDSSDTGGGGDHGSDKAGLEAASKDYATTLISDDPSGAYEYLTADCKSTITKEAFKKEIKDGLEAIKQYASNGDSLSIGDVKVKDVGDDKGKVAIDLLGSDGKPLTDGTQTDSSDPSYDDWIYEDGEWHPTGCGGMGDDTADSASATFDTVGSSIGS